MSENVLITGSSGFIGYAVAQRLLGMGQSVVGLDRICEPTLPFPTIAADLNDLHSLYGLLKTYGVTQIVHSGAISGPMLARDNPFLISNANLTGTVNLLEAARVMGIRRFVYCSSASAYGDTPPAPVTEGTPFKPTDIYGATKAGGDLLVQAYGFQGHVDSVALRFSWVYGPRRRTDCLIRSLIENASHGISTRLDWGEGFHRQFIYIEDAVNAIVEALKASTFPQRAYTITGGSWLSIPEIVAVVQTVVPGVEVTLGSGPDPVDCIQAEFDIAAAGRDLGYHPSYSLAQGVQAYAHWLADPS